MTWQVGNNASFTKTITETDVVLFAGISGDTNPVHINEEYAKKTRFKGRIAHGPYVTGLIGTVLGTKMPGPGTIYLGQTLKFTAPVHIGDTITARCEITHIRTDKPIFTIACLVMNHHQVKVMEGEAVVLYSPIEGLDVPIP
ncbi:MAG: MaoC family dehydratase [Proteobacteria bacterium]|jgi:3-hydroxybutyryl-CoA dehydratase|nr:MaoC family dehydratase [Pseudomonadota bacterium]